MNLQITPQSTDREERRQGRGRSRAIRPLIGLVVLALLLAGFYYYTHKPEGGEHHPTAAPPVKVSEAVQRDMAVIERTIGTVVANATVSVTAQVQGKLVAANFKEGQMVKTGDLLFQIDPRPYQATYDNAVANVASTKAKADRYQRLLGQNAISPQDADDTQAAYLEAKATAESARLNLEFTHINSPVDGKTGAILLQPGNLVSINGTSTPLVTITQIQPIKVSFSLPQADLPRIQARAHSAKGLTAKVVLHDAGGEDLNAPVDFVSNAVSNNSGTIELRSTFANTDAALVPGQLVDVVVELADIPNAIVVPREAVNIGSDGQFVYVVTPDKTAVQTPVKVLFDDGTNAAISGRVAAGDKVIVDGQLRVLAGGKVSFSHVQLPHKGGGNDGKGEAGGSPSAG